MIEQFQPRACQQIIKYLPTCWKTPKILSMLEFLVNVAIITATSMLFFAVCKGRIQVTMWWCFYHNFCCMMMKKMVKERNKRLQILCYMYYRRAWNWGAFKKRRESWYKAEFVKKSCIRKRTPDKECTTSSQLNVKFSTPAYFASFKTKTLKGHTYCNWYCYRSAALGLIEQNSKIL